MNKILDGYAKHLQMRSFINSTFSDLPLDERALTIFQDNPEAVPKFFRSELHGSPEFFDLLAHRVVRRIASCILKTQTLVLYPVYMGRMNLPNLKQNLNGFHQDSLYTYEYFNINASAESMEMLMSSQVNFWAPLKDVSRESGTLVIRRGAENRICRYGELERRVYGERVAELVTDPSELPEEELADAAQLAHLLEPFLLGAFHECGEWAASEDMNHLQSFSAALSQQLRKTP
mmetsp:Transcript_41018/g.98059  ORF Transcript_41018/g.98059 Transcript_41018/m.98059 type:complete len:233 (-) Transcript_41018:44-742(-)